MKIIITESRLERLAINWLNDNFGDLEPYETEKYPNQVFYRKGKEIIFKYKKKMDRFFLIIKKYGHFLNRFLVWKTDKFGT